MTINTLYIPLFTIEEVILDKDTGLPLSGGVVRFYRDSQRVTPKDVYTISGVSPNYTFTNVGAVFTLGISGTFVDGSGNPFVPYAYPYDAAGELDLYYVTVVSEGGVAQFTRQAVPYTGAGDIPPEDRINTENELSNPQFVEVNFPAGITTISVTGTNTVTPIAPGWDLITTGTDTIELERLEPTAANVPTNPPYTLRIEAGSSLGSSITLRQRLLHSPSLMRGQFISGTLTAAVIGGGGSALSMAYAPSTGTATTIIPSTSISTDGAYHSISGNAEIPQQVNTAATTGYVDINIVIPTSRNIAITSIQIVGVATGVDIPFDQQTADRQKDHLFHYYEPSILYQPKDTILTGWNFPLNPYQFITQTVTTNVAQTKYICDQTILHQEAASQIASGIGTNADRFGLKIMPVNNATDTKFALVTYPDTTTTFPYWSYKLSALAKLRFNSTHSTTVRFKMLLMYRTAGAPPTLGAAEPIAGWSGDELTLAAGWTAIKPVNDPVYSITTSSAGAYENYVFNGFQLPAASTDTMYLSAVFYTVDDMDSTAGTQDYFVFDKISLVANDIAIDTQPQTFDDVMRQCQFYYEKSYDYLVLPGAAATKGMLTRQQHSTESSANGKSTNFEVEFSTIKRSVAPTIAFYLPAGGAAGSVLATFYRDGVVDGTANVAIAGTWTQEAVSSKAFSYLPAGNTTIVVAGSGAALNNNCIIQFQYTADARLGI